MFGLAQPFISLPSRRLFHTTTRKATSHNRFFVYAPDYPNSVARRYSVREAHLADVNPYIKNGVFRVAGMLVDPEQPTTKIGDETRNNATGSILIIEAETLEEARRMVEKDVYWRNGVWDKEKVIIQPFVAATPFP